MHDDVAPLAGLAAGDGQVTEGAEIPLLGKLGSGIGDRPADVCVRAPFEHVVLDRRPHHPSSGNAPVIGVIRSSRCGANR